MGEIALDILKIGPLRGNNMARFGPLLKTDIPKIPLRRSIPPPGRLDAIHKSDISYNK